MELIFGVGFDMAIFTILCIPVIKLWSKYVKTKTPSPDLVGLVTFLGIVVYFSFFVFFCFWNAKAEDDAMRAHMPASSLEGRGVPGE